MGISGRIAAFFLRNSMTPLLAVLALLLGLFATLITPREEEPQIDVTMANVLVPFPGASAKDVESLVARPAEQVLSRMAGIDHVYSVARPGLAVITVQFQVGVPNQTALVRLYDTIHSHQDWLSPNLGVGAPIIKPKGIDDVPIVALTFWSRDEGKSAFELQQVSRAAEIELKRINGTRDVETIGGPGHVIRVAMDTERMNAHGVTAQDLRNAFQLSNASQPAGSLVSGGKEVLVQTGTYIESAADVKALVVGVANGRPVTVADVAKVIDGPDQPIRYVWFGLGRGAATVRPEPVEGRGNGDAFHSCFDKPVLSSVEGLSTNGAECESPAVTLSISKKPGVNAADVAEAVIARAQGLKGTVIPEGVEFTVTRNYGETATDKAQKLIGKLVFATLFVVLLVLFALGKREAVIVGTAVTLTLAATLFASWAWGFTLNRVSLFALIFSIGILVDDAIVVVENIHRWQNLYPEKTLLEIIPGAVNEVGGPTILATFTVIAALLPMAFVSGLMGPYMSPIPINASMGMFISLAIAFVVTPWLALKLMKGHGVDDNGTTSAMSSFPRKREYPEGHASRFFDHRWIPAFAGMTKFGQWLFSLKARSGVSILAEKIFPPLLDESHGARNRRKLWLGVVVAIVLSVSLGVFKLVILKMLPFDNKSEFQVVLDMPVGTPVEETARVLREMSAVLGEVEEVRDYQAYAGTASPINFNGLVRQYYLRSNPEMGDIQVNLVDKHHRSRQSHEVAVSIRARLLAIAREHGGNAKLVEVPPGPPVLSPIVAEVYGPDYEGQIGLAKQVRKAFEGTADIVGVDDTVDEAADKIVLRVSQAKAALAGVAQRDIVDVVRMALSGEDVTPVHDGESKYEVPVHVVLPAERQDAIGQLLQLRVRAGNGALVPVSELVEVRKSRREQVIYHKDLLPVVYVTADMGGKLDSPLYGMFAIRSKLNVGLCPSTSEASTPASATRPPLIRGDGGVTVPAKDGKGSSVAQENQPPQPPLSGGSQCAPLDIDQYFIHQPKDPYAAYALKWDGEWQITYETFRDMGAAYAVGLVLIYLLVVAQFGSYLVPLIIMAPIPLTIIGVMPGHALLGSQFTATSMIGMIALAGIIVRNSILLVDFINQQVAEGIDFAEAVIRSAAVRAKPIALTGLAAMLGALFILDDPIFNGLAISLIFGILVSTVLTLVVIPVLYYAAMKNRITKEPQL